MKGAGVRGPRWCRAGPGQPRGAWVTERVGAGAGARPGLQTWALTADPPQLCIILVRTR